MPNYMNMDQTYEYVRVSLAGEEEMGNEKNYNDEGG